MATHDQSYQATGADLIGFLTKDLNSNTSPFQIGAQIQGDTVGVHGISPGGPGVLGESQRVYDSGVRGENFSPPNDIGDKGGTGVRGETNSNDGQLVPGAGVMGFNVGNGPGVLGSSSSGDGVRGSGLIGVHGIGVSAGVKGESGLGVGAGVIGENTSEGIGVVGTSKNGYGGEFSSGDSSIGAVGLAPLHLKPSVTITGPPQFDPNVTHQTGEFFVDKLVALYFCIADGQPGSWKKVQLV
jgi:hypothetical protein